MVGSSARAGANSRRGNRPLIVGRKCRQFVFPERRWKTPRNVHECAHLSPRRIVPSMKSMMNCLLLAFRPSKPTILLHVLLETPLVSCHGRGCTFWPCEVLANIRAPSHIDAVFPPRWSRHQCSSMVKESMLKRLSTTHSLMIAVPGRHSAISCGGAETDMAARGISVSPYAKSGWDIVCVMR